MGILAVEFSPSGQGSSTETSRLLQLLSTLNGKTETFSFSSQKSHYCTRRPSFRFCHNLRAPSSLRRGPLGTLAWEDRGCSWRHGRLLCGLLCGSPLCVLKQKWLKSGSSFKQQLFFEQLSPPFPAGMGGLCSAPATELREGQTETQTRS